MNLCQMQWPFNPLKGLRQNAYLPLLYLFLSCICVVCCNPKTLIWANAGKTQWADVPDKSKFLRNEMYCQFTYCTRDETRRAELYISNKTSTLFSVSLDREDGLLPSSSPSLPTCQFFRGLLSKSAGVVVDGHQGFRILNDSYQNIFYVMKYGAQCSSGL